MSLTRSGLQYGGGYDENQGLAPDLGSDAPWTDQQILAHVRNDFQTLAARPDINTATGNIAAILVKFSGLEIYYQLAYSNSSGLDLDVRYQFDLAPQTSTFASGASQQENDQARNHTEPKLMQEFVDRFLFNGSPLKAKLKWVCIVTDRPVCGSCLNYTVIPFRRLCAQRGWRFFVIDLRGAIQSPQWQPVRTVHA